MKVSVEAIKALREKTSASLNDVRAALKSAGGDEAKAIELLRQRGAQIAEKRQGRVTGQGRGQGRVESYVHHDGSLSALVEVHCETDFVARTQEFTQFCRDVAMQVAAMRPRYIRPEDVPSSEGVSAEELKAVCLLEQPFVKDQGTMIKDLLKTLIAKTGENVVIRRFVRLAVGETPVSAL
jgi:elongation factor Ts